MQLQEYQFVYGLHMQLQTYQISIKASNWADIPYFIYVVQMQLMEYQISFMGSKCSCRHTRFHLWAPNVVDGIPDFIYGLQMQLQKYQISFIGL